MDQTASPNSIAERQADMNDNIKAAVQHENHRWHDHLDEDEAHHRDQAQQTPSRARESRVSCTEIERKVQEAAKYRDDD